jgi:SAM-dependent methyltransferase
MPRPSLSLADNARNLRARAACDGLGSTLTYVARTVLAPGLAPIERRMLEREQQRGVLGPAHRWWYGNSSRDNRDQWQRWDWKQLGEEWTESEDWKATFVDEVLLPTVPAGGTVLEIGPGGGRWSEFLIPRADRAILVDVTPKVLELCRERFEASANVEFVLSNGSDLPGVPDESVDAVWSYDVFVHIAPIDQAEYLTAVARVLRRGAVAAIHHADGRDRGRLPSAQGWRAPMSSYLFRRLAEDRGLVVESEVRSWGCGRFGLGKFADTISVLRRPVEPEPEPDRGTDPTGRIERVHAAAPVSRPSA